MKILNFGKNTAEKKVSTLPSSREIKVVKRSYGRIILIFVSIIVSVFLWIFIQKRDAWVFTNTEYVGLVNLNKSTLDMLIQDELGKPMSKINPNILEKKIKENFVEISAIRADKLFPNTVKFTLEEKTPAFVYVDINGYYLVDTNGEVLKAYTTDSPNQFSSKDYELARGFGSPNADYVEDRIINSLEEKDKEGFKFEEYDYSKKEEVLAAIELERKTKLDDVVNSQYKEASKSDWGKVPFVLAWDEKTFKTGDIMDQDQVKFFVGAINKFSKVLSEVHIDGILWDGDQRLIFYFDVNSEIIVSPKRDLDQQKEDFVEVVQKIGGLGKIKQIDLSVDHILVEYR